MAAAMRGGSPSRARARGRPKIAQPPRRPAKPAKSRPYAPAKLAAAQSLGLAPLTAVSLAALIAVVGVTAALGPRMLELSASHADGAHPYNTNPEHTAQARGILGPQPYLCPEQAVVLESDPQKARGVGRAFLGFYLSLPNYANNLLRLGFDESDFKDGGSNRLIDAIIAWGDLSAIRNRIREHHSAGADHVCIQVLTSNPKELPWREWREMASGALAK